MKPFLLTSLCLVALYVTMPVLLSHMSWESAMRVIGCSMTIGGFLIGFAFLPRTNTEK